MTPPCRDALLDGLAGPHDPDQALERLRDLVRPFLQSEADEEAVLAFTVDALLDQMLQHRDAYVEEVEKPYGEPWAVQFRWIQEDALDNWDDALRTVWPGAPVKAIASIIRTGRSYRRVEPQHSVGS